MSEDKLTLADFRKAKADLIEASKKYVWTVTIYDCGCKWGCGVKEGDDFASYEFTGSRDCKWHRFE